jgi:hypothetical protein
MVITGCVTMLLTRYLGNSYDELALRRAEERYLIQSEKLSYFELNNPKTLKQWKREHPEEAGFWESLKLELK